MNNGKEKIKLFCYTQMGDVRFSYKNVRISYKICKKTVLLQICSFDVLHFCSIADESKSDQFWVYWWWRKHNSKKKLDKKIQKFKSRIVT